jgi:hypothetical protein
MGTQRLENYLVNPQFGRIEGGRGWFYFNELPRSKLRGIKNKGKERSKLREINPVEIKVF